MNELENMIECIATCPGWAAAMKRAEAAMAAVLEARVAANESWVALAAAEKAALDALDALAALAPPDRAEREWMDADAQAVAQEKDRRAAQYADFCERQSKSYKKEKD